MEKFDNKKYDARMDFINAYFQEGLAENEEIRIEANVGWKSTGDIDISYHRVQNKKHKSAQYSLRPEMMCDLSDITVQAICADLLNKFRG